MLQQAIRCATNRFTATGTRSAAGSRRPARGCTAPSREQAPCAGAAVEDIGHPICLALGGPDAI
jgi:hypothetical protein